MLDLSMSTDGARTTLTGRTGRIFGHLTSLDDGRCVVDVLPLVGPAVSTVVGSHDAALELFRTLTATDFSEGVPCGDVRTRWGLLAADIRDGRPDQVHLGIISNEDAAWLNVILNITLDVDDVRELVAVLQFAAARSAVIA